MHQHLDIGAGDVNWDASFEILGTIGFLDRDDALFVSNVFAEDERHLASVVHKRTQISALVAAHQGSKPL